MVIKGRVVHALLFSRLFASSLQIGTMWVNSEMLMLMNP